MKIKITHPIGDYHAGLIYDVPDEEALKLIARDFAFEFVDDAAEIVNVTALADNKTVLVEGAKKKKVKYDR